MVPNKLIMQSCTRAGVRRPKLKRFQRPAPVQQWNPWHPVGSLGRPLERASSCGGIVPRTNPNPITMQDVLAGCGKRAKQVRDKAIDGNLLNQDFRFFFGSATTGSRYSECRVCKAMCFSAQERKDHMEETGHTVCLVRAYAMMNREKMCVMCDAKTLRSVWGVYLCSRTCQFEWMFHPGKKSYAMQAALRQLQHTEKYLFERGNAKVDI